MIGKYHFRLVILCVGIMLFPEVSGSVTLDMPLNQLEVYKGEEIYLECAVDNLETHTVTWTKGGKKIAVGESVLTKDSRISILRPYNRDWNLNIDRAKATDQGVYTCRVNTTPPQSGSVRVTVVANN